MTVMLASAAAPRHSSAEILRDMKKLSVLGGALYVAAHPDDENTKLLATLANDTMVRTAYLAFTRGEGGQNLIGQELGPLLGVIRTQELLAARRIDGAEQFFTRAQDFGFSKSVDETLRIWDHDAVLADAVKVIRTVKPDVIITRFSLEAGDTHGHHTASARLALEAFKAAADPLFHPENGKPWAAKRIVWNAWSFDPAQNAKLEQQSAFHMDASPYSPLLGMTYGELAAESRSQHKSQGFGAAPIHGPSVENFQLLGGDAGKSLFDGVDLTWKRVGQQDPFKKIAADFKADNPAASIPALLKAHELLRAQPDHPYKQQKLEELERVIADCAGVFVEAAAPVYSVVPGGTLDVNLTILTRAAPLTVKELKFFDGQTLPPTALKATVKIPDSLHFTSPEWLDRATIEPEPPSELWVDVTFVQKTFTFTVRRPLVYKWTDPTIGERYRQIEVLPPTVVKAQPNVLVFSDNKPKTVKLTVTANADNQTGDFGPDAGYSLAKKGDIAEVVVQLSPEHKLTPNADGRTPIVEIESDEGNLLPYATLTRVDYPHIPIQTVLTPARVKIVRTNLQRGKISRVGYIPGAGDEVPEALRQVGYEVTLLDDSALATKPLTFDAIVIGIRAYNVNPKLAAHHARLMNYVNDGGTLLVQYNTKNRVSDVPAQIGPYPFEISRDRVTDETAEVTLEQPLKGPNTLTPSDFDGWVQERGLYFANTWDPKYTTPLSMHDPNEPAKKGSVLIAKSGKGTFIYTGLSFFRQLPAGVPGAYRLFANLLAYGH
jgi:LmbE family N-acetylglucosaminyl deacetylase